MFPLPLADGVLPPPLAKATPPPARTTKHPPINVAFNARRMKLSP
jgi:hypothetical protein